MTAADPTGTLVNHPPVRDKRKFSFKLYLNNYLFANILNKIQKSKDLSDKTRLSKVLLNKVSILNPNFSHAGFFSSEIIEDVFLEIANTYPMCKEYSPANKHSFLHVLTVGWSMGGHTRVTENWILNAPAHETHSVVFVNQDYHPALDFVRSATDKTGGDLFFLGLGGDDTEKALKLRELSLNYEFVILNICTDDYIPLIAFGHINFPRPILLFAQSDFSFWLGVSIADAVLELSHAGMEFSRRRRGVTHNFVLPCPISNIQTRERVAEQSDLRNDLVIDKNTKILVTMGSPYKYRPWGKYNFISTLKKIMDSERNTVCIAIGPDSSDPNFMKIAKHDHRIKLLGILPLEEANKYLDIADVYLDSFPVFGGMAGLDLVKRKIPCISLQTPIFHFDYSVNSPGFCMTEDEYINKAVQALRDPDFAKNTGTCAYANAMKDHSHSNWSEKLCEVFAKLPTKHNIQQFKTVADKNSFGEIDHWLLDVTINKRHPTKIQKHFNRLAHMIRKFINNHS